MSIPNSAKSKHYLFKIKKFKKYMKMLTQSEWEKVNFINIRLDISDKYKHQWALYKCYKIKSILKSILKTIWKTSTMLNLLTMLKTNSLS